MLQGYRLFLTAIMSTRVVVQDHNMSTSNPEICKCATCRGNREVSRSAYRVHAPVVRAISSGDPPPHPQVGLLKLVPVF